MNLQEFRERTATLSYWYQTHTHPPKHIPLSGWDTRWWSFLGTRFIKPRYWGSLLRLCISCLIALFLRHLRCLRRSLNNLWWRSSSVSFRRCSCFFLRSAVNLFCRICSDSNRLARWSTGLSIFSGCSTTSNRLGNSVHKHTHIHTYSLKFTTFNLSHMVGNTCSQVYILCL